MNTQYDLQIPSDIEQRILKLGEPVQEEFRVRLREVLRAAAVGHYRALKQALSPPLRVDADGYGMVYQVEPDSRRVVVLELRKVFA